MPASDSTFHNMKRLHAVFAVSSLALLAVTLWMLSADHWREWKVYQRTFRDRVEPWLTEARIRETRSEEFTAREEELEEAIRKARGTVPDRDAIQRFCAELERQAARRGVSSTGRAAIEAAYEALAAQPGDEARRELLARLSEAVTAAENRTAGVARQLRSRRAQFNEARSFFEAGVGEGVSQQKLDRLQRRVDRVKQAVDALSAQSEEASAHSEALTKILGEITRQEDKARRALADHRAQVDRFERALTEERWNLGKQFLRLPLIDAFGRPLAIEQTWLPGLTIDYHFRRVARFDRCTTCHQGIDTTRPGSSSEPACLGQEVFTVELAVPPGSAREEDEEEREEDAGRSPGRPALKQQAHNQSSIINHQSSIPELYGLTLAPRGILDPNEATIGLVRPRTPAADAELLAGDVIEKIDGVKIADRGQARRILLEAALNDYGRFRDARAVRGSHDPAHAPTEGLPNQGGLWREVSARSGDLRRARARIRQLHLGSGSLELEIRRGLPHPYSSHPRLDLFVGSQSPHPASRFGCTICHDGQGSATEFKFASHTPNDPIERARWRKEHDWFWNPHWDFPMRPRRFAEAGCLRCHHAVTDLAPSPRFPDPPAPKLLAGYNLVRRSGCFGCHEIRGVTASGERVGPDMRLAPYDREAAKDSTAGTMSKVGPSLRNVADKLDAVFLDDWLRNPRDFRPDTRMPQFYGLHEHLGGKSLTDARRFEAVEIHALSDYLLAISEPLEPLGAADVSPLRGEPGQDARATRPPPELTEPPSAERGKRLFLTQGCLACHRHDDFPKARSVRGPNLSNLALKLNHEVGRKWLVSWIRDPARHSPKTRMPNTLLKPAPLVDEGRGAEGEAARPRMTDPAADIAAYLLQSPEADDGPGGAGVSPVSGNHGQDARAARPLVESDLDDLVLLHLAPVISRRLALAYLKGEVELTAEQAQGDAVELVGRVTLEKKVRYVGRRTIAKRGCFGCHDIPGFENAQPIGPPLSDWGRKQQSLLAFGQIHQFLAKAAGDEKSQAHPSPLTPHPSPLAEGFYTEALHAHRREGFLWQKLRAPRSFDYKTTENKGYNEWLTMGRFSFTPDECEAIITFVLGLVSDPPAADYVYQGDRRRRAIAEGRKVLDKYGCAECHTLEMERWLLEYDPEEIEAPYEVDDFAFLAPRVDAESLETSAKPDRRGLLHAEAVGMAERDEEGEVLEDEDDDDHPMVYVNLWEPLSLKVRGEWPVWPAGAQLGISDPHQVATHTPGATGVSPVPGGQGQDARATPRRTVEAQHVRPTYTPHLIGTRPAVGGAFARLLFPHVLDEENPAVMAAWGWVPPPLVGEGLKVRPEWLYDYLLEPFAIRPAAVLRMPKYNMSPEEAGKLVDYFAAVAGVDFPYHSDPRGRSADLAAKELVRPNRLDDAMRIVIDRTTYCTKCHLVGDYSPGGETRTVLAPRLDRVGRRLRPEYLHRWLANPKTLLPYTGMPVNFPPAGPPMGQNLFEGSSLEQLDAVMDLLLDYHEYASGRTSIRAVIESSEKTRTRTGAGGE